MNTKKPVKFVACFDALTTGPSKMAPLFTAALGCNDADVVEYDDRRLSFGSAMNRLKNSDLGIAIEFDEKLADALINDQSRIAFFTLDVTGNQDFDELVLRAAEDPAFSCAYVFDAEYVMWQNMNDIHMFDAAHRPHQHLPKMLSGLPAPFDTLVIDTSRNVGRTELRTGYEEAVAAQMWFSRHLVDELGTDVSGLAALPGVKVAWKGDVLFIRSSVDSFCTDEGEEGQLQVKLRELIFNN